MGYPRGKLDNSALRLPWHKLASDCPKPDSDHIEQLTHTSGIGSFWNEIFNDPIRTVFPHRN